MFTWNDSLQAEFDNLKSAMKESIKLPLDTNKKIFCYTDTAVTCGMAYLLLQKKQESDEERDP